MNIKDQVPSRCWYYMLEWNDKNNWKMMQDMFDKIKLHELTLQEFWQIFNYATQKDVEDLLQLSQQK